MTLYLDTHNPQEVIVKIGPEETVLTAAKNNLTINLQKRLLRAIDHTLKEAQITPQQLTAIEIHPGPGSFTGLRIGFAVGNTLAQSLRVPINGQKVACPNYGQPPSITPRKK